MAAPSFLWWINCYSFVSSTQKSGWAEGGSPMYGVHVPGTALPHHTFQHHPCISPPKKLTVKDHMPHPSPTTSTEVTDTGSTLLELRKKRTKQFREYLWSYLDTLLRKYRQIFPQKLHLKRKLLREIHQHYQPIYPFKYRQFS